MYLYKQIKKDLTLTLRDIPTTTLRPRLADHSRPALASLEERRSSFLPDPSTSTSCLVFLWGEGWVPYLVEEGEGWVTYLVRGWVGQVAVGPDPTPLSEQNHRHE